MPAKTLRRKGVSGRMTLKSKLSRVSGEDFPIKSDIVRTNVLHLRANPMGGLTQPDDPSSGLIALHDCALDLQVLFKRADATIQQIIDDLALPLCASDGWSYLRRILDRITRCEADISEFVGDLTRSASYGGEPLIQKGEPLAEPAFAVEEVHRLDSIAREMARLRDELSRTGKNETRDSVLNALDDACHFMVEHLAAASVAALRSHSSACDVIYVPALRAKAALRRRGLSDQDELMNFRMVDGMPRPCMPEARERIGLQECATKCGDSVDSLRAKWMDAFGDLYPSIFAPVESTGAAR